MVPQDHETDLMLSALHRQESLPKKNKQNITLIFFCFIPDFKLDSVPIILQEEKQKINTVLVQSSVMSRIAMLPLILLLCFSSSCFKAQAFMGVLFN